IDLNLMIGLKRPLARRLYEYLPKQFLKKNTFSIGIDKLFPKIGLIKRRYNSDVIRQIKSIQSAINQINAFDENHVYSIEHYKNDHGRFICTFRREDKENKKREVPAIEDNINVDVIIEKLKQFKVHGNSIRSIIRQHPVVVLNDVIADFEFLLKKKSKSNHPIENPGAYFRSLLPKPGDAHEFSIDYQKHLKSEELKKDIKRHQEERNRKEQQSEMKRRREVALRDKTNRFFKQLPEKEQEQIRIQAEACVDNQTNRRPGFILLAIHEIVQKNYNVTLEDAD
ncbi:hypothetical protein ACQZV8_11880, partial [Magnetococcales bacterium HHB-1]